MVDTNSQCSIVLLEASCNNSRSPPISTLHAVDVDCHPLTPEILVTSPRHVPKSHLHEIKLAEETESEEESEESDSEIEDSELEFIDLNQEEDVSIQSMLALEINSRAIGSSNSYDSANITDASSTFQSP